MNSGVPASAQPQKVLSLSVNQSAYGQTIPRAWGKVRLPSNLLWYGDFVGTAVPAEQQGGKGGGGGGGISGYTYRAAMMLALCSGPIINVGRVWKDKEQSTLAALGFELATGALGQAVWSHLTTNHPAEAIGYSGIAHLRTASFDLGDQPSAPNLSFEIFGERTGDNGDARPEHIITDIVCDPVEGLGLPESILDLTDYALWCAQKGFTLALAADTQKPTRDYLQDILDATLAEAVPSQGKIKIVPYGDEAVGSWTPNATPVYHITHADLMADPSIDIPDPSRATNSITVEFKNRDRDYNSEPITKDDITAVTQYGLRSDSKTLACISRKAMASEVAEWLRDRALHIRKRVTIRVDERFLLAEPMDLLSVSFDPQGLSQFVGRIKSMNFDGSEIEFELEEWPFGIASQPAIPTQDSGGYVPDLNVSPGNANVPVIFEPPSSLSGDPQIWLATSGGANWGGCEVHVSLDDATYSKVGIISGPMRHGIITAALPLQADPDNINTLAVDVSVSSATLLPATADARDLYQSLCYVAGAGGELVAYQGATLTGAGQYALTNLRRGAYGTPIGLHPIGSKFARLDGTEYRYSYDPALVGKTIYIKLRSFNKFGAALQDLADVTATAYVVQGAPLGAVSGLALETPFTGRTLAVKWNAYPGASSYSVELWHASTLRRTVTGLSAPRFETTISQLLADSIGRSVELRVRAVSANGQSSTAAVIVANNAQHAAPSITVQTMAGGLIVTAAPSTAADYLATRIAISQTNGFDPAAATPYYDGPQTAYPSPALAAGTWYVRVAQYDQFGADGLNWTSQVSVAVSEIAAGVITVSDATAITATTGSDAPGGAAYRAVYSAHNDRMYVWRPDLIPARYVSANSAADIEGTIAEAQLSAPFLGRIQDIEDFAADESTRVDVLESSVKGGGNLLPNAAFESDASGWEVGYNPGSYSYAPMRDNAGSAWTPIGGHQIGFNIVGAFSGAADIRASPMQQACVPGARYCISAWLAAHRCDITFALVWHDSTGTYISEHHTPSVGPASGTADGGGTNVASWVRRHLFVTAPSNARTVYVFLRIYAVAGLADPYGWAYQPMLEQADANQTQPSPWAPSSAGIRARVTTVEQAVATESSTRATAITDVNARLNTGGDVRTAIVQVQSEATATTDRLTATHSITLSAGGTVSGLRAFNDGTTSALRIAADQVLFSPGELFDDPFFDNADRWLKDAGGWNVEDVSLPGDNGPERLGVRRCVVLWSGTFSAADVRKHYYTQPFNLPCQPGEPLRLSAKGRNASNQTVVAAILFWDAAGAYVSGAEVAWPAGALAEYKRVIFTPPANASVCRIYAYNDQTSAPGVAFSGVAEIGDIRLVRAVGASLVVDGSITATQIDTAYTNTTILSARTAVIDYAAVNTLSAISANLGTMTAGTITLTGAGWNYLRTDSKWWNDGVNGWISAARAETNSHFQEFRASNGSALVLEQKGGGVDVGGLHYRLLVRDAAGVDRLDINPAGAGYKFRGRIEATEGFFTGNITSAATVSGASGYFGSITGGALHNEDDTAGLYLDSSSNGPLLRAGERTLITHEGRTYFNNSIFGQWIGGLSLKVWDVENGITSGRFTFDLGIDFNIGDFSDASFSAQVSGYTATWDITGWKFRFIPRVCFITPVAGASWSTSRLHVRLDVEAFGPISDAFPAGGGSGVITLNSVFIRVLRLT